MRPLSEDERQMLASLQAAVSEALERKRRLGQYAVVWENGQPTYLGPPPPVATPDYRVEARARAGGVADGDE